MPQPREDEVREPGESMTLCRDHSRSYCIAQVPSSNESCLRRAIATGQLIPQRSSFQQCNERRAQDHGGLRSVDMEGWILDCCPKTHPTVLLLQKCQEDNNTTDEGPTQIILSVVASTLTLSSSLILHIAANSPLISGCVSRASLYSTGMSSPNISRYSSLFQPAAMARDLAVASLMTSA